MELEGVLLAQPLKIMLFTSGLKAESDKICQNRRPSSAEQIRCITNH